MPDLSFSQPERRNFLVPGIIVVVLVACALGYIYFFTPHSTAEVQVTHVAYMPLHTSYETGSKVVGHMNVSEDDIYVLATVRVHNNLSLPIIIKDLTGTLTPSDGPDITVSAIEKNDLDSVYEALPKLKAMSGPSLLRDITIAPGATAEGMVMLDYQATEAIWKQRKSASVTIVLYHQDPTTVPIPQ